MIKNYLITALRNIVKSRGYSLINILGLAVGMACGIFIFLFVQFHAGFDSQVEDPERVYRLGIVSQSENGTEIRPANFPKMADVLKEKYPEVELAGRHYVGWFEIVKYGANIFREIGLYDADTDFLRIVNAQFVRGDIDTALERPDTTVITERIALKYFGDANPIGKLLKLGDKEFEVTGVVKNPPANSKYQYSIIKTWKTLAQTEHMRDWSPMILMAGTLVKLRPGTDAEAFEDKIAKLPHDYVGKELVKLGAVYRNYLQPFDELHLYHFTPGGKKPARILVYIYVFIAIGVFILLIACMNFMNLATARSANRAGEVGIRKVVGALRKQLVRQFLGESLFLTVISFIAALVLVEIFIPFFNDLAGVQVSSGELLTPLSLVVMLGLVLIVGLAAGMYPAFFLSFFKPVSVLKGALSQGSRGMTMRKIMVVGQFVISIALVIATLTVFRQVNYMKTQPLGFDKNQKMVISLRSWRMITDRHETVKNEFLRHPSIHGAFASSGVPGIAVNRTWIFPTGQEKTKGQALRSLRCDHDFLSVMDIPIVAGRGFDKKIPTDTIKSIIINEAAVKAFGWSSPQEALDQPLWARKYPVIGVVKDFHWFGLQRPIEPMLIRVVPELFRYITLKVDNQNLEETIKYAESTFNKLFPGELFEYVFVDRNFDQQYKAEEQMGRIVSVFTFLGLFIAGLGLLGLASFISQQRTKEIGIRKVLGARVSGIVLLLSKEFARWVLAANIIAWPLAWWVMNKWLENFAYRTSMGIDIFIMSGLFTLVLALLIVIYQSARAARANPVDSLRYE